MDIRFIKLTQVKNEGIFIMDITFIKFTQVKNEGIFYMDIRFIPSKHSIPISIIKEIPFKIFPSPSIFQRNLFKNFFHLFFLQENLL